MVWPTPQDYDEAVQNPLLNLQDTDLRGGQVELNALGLPRPVTGNFASVYRMHCGSRDWAIRCFWREYADMPERYAAIGEHLIRTRLPYTVHFQFLQHGIRSRGNWYPALKMEWVDGELLSTYIERMLHDGPALRRLAARWACMTLALEADSISHGDLQHGNVLVVGNDVKLVDYDAMRVPLLGHRPCLEIGHPNYQHPLRSSGHIDLGLDRFSAWVIYVSLLALAWNPELWVQLRGGDECLIFRKADFLDPTHSDTFRLLSDATDAAVLATADKLASFTTMSLETIPPLPNVDDALSRVRTSKKRILVPDRFGHGVSSQTTGEAPRVPHWMSGHERQVSGAILPRFTTRVRFARASALLLVAFAGVSILSMESPGLSGVVRASIMCAVVSLVAFISLFVREPAVGARLLARLEQARIALRLRKLRRVQRQLSKRKARLIKRCERREATCRRHEFRIDAWYQNQVLRLITLTGELQRILREDISLVREGEKNAVEEDLSAVRKRYVESRLRGTRLVGSDAPEIGAAAKAYLWIRGIRRCSHAQPDRIARLGSLDPEQKHELLSWRTKHVDHAVRSAPRSLSAEREDSIRAPFCKQAQALDGSMANLEKREALFISNLAVIKEHRIEQVKSAHESHLDGLSGKLAHVEVLIESARTDVAFEHWRLTTAHARLKTYQRVSFGAYLRRLVHL